MDPYILHEFLLPSAFGEKYNENISKTKKQDKKHYQNILSHQFYDLDAITIANIDAIFNITHHIGGYLGKQSLGFGSFCNISDKYGWSYYFLYRLPQYYGFMKTKTFKDDNYIDFSRLNILYDDYEKKVLEKESSGVNILITTSDNYDDNYINLINNKGSIIIELQQKSIDITNILINIIKTFKYVYIINPLISDTHFIVAYEKEDQNKEINVGEIKRWAETQLKSFSEIPKEWLPYKILIYFNLPQSTQILNKEKIKLFYDEITIGKKWI